MEPASVILILVVVAAAIAAWIYEHRAAALRRQVMEEMATRFGLTYREGDAPDGHRMRAPFPIFSKGHGQKAGPTLAGNTTMAGMVLPTLAGDFLYKETSGTGKNRSTRTYRFSYLILRLPHHTPGLAIRPEGLFDRLAAAFGFDDINFESAAFSKTFHVTGKDRRFAYDLIHPNMMEYLLAHGPMTLTLSWDLLLIGDGTSQLAPSQFQKVMEFADGFLSLWPEHLRQRLATRSTGS